MEEKLWKILEEGTMGWELADPDAVRLTKEQAKAQKEAAKNKPQPSSSSSSPK